MAHLIKRSSDLVDSGFISKTSVGTFHCETRVNAKPSGCNMALGDQIFVAETGYAIYAKGVVEVSNDIVYIHNLEELFQYYQTSGVKSTKY